jgi:hypothetical protein
LVNIFKPKHITPLFHYKSPYLVMGIS